MNNINDDDKLWAALCWVIPIIAIVVLFIEVAPLLSTMRSIH